MFPRFAKASLTRARRPVVRDDRRAAARYAAELETLLGPLTDTDLMSDRADTAEIRLDGLKARIVELEKNLRDGAR